MQIHQDATPSGPTTPLVSFIVTYYNLPVPMLTSCLDSLLALSLRPFERQIIVIDDGSKASPVNDLQRYANDITYIRTPNNGLGGARNIGLQLATGRFVQFVDGDDWLIQGPYEHCLDLARYGHADLIMFDFTHDDTTQGVFRDTKPVSGTYHLRHNNLQGMACGYLFSRAILGEVRFTTGIYHEDEEFTPLLLLRAESVVTTDAKAYHYRQRPDSIVSDTHIRQRLKRLNDTKYVLCSLQQTADTLPHDQRLALKRRIAQLTMDYIYNIIRQTQSRHYLDRRLGELRQLGLFPLPDDNYTTKYTWFRRLSGSSRGLSLLMRLIPMTEKER